MIKLCIILLLSLIASAQPPLDPSGTLTGVIQVFRHGVREALYNFWDAKDYLIDQGELRNPGMRQHFLLGDAYRKRYIEDAGFLSGNLNHSEFYLLSTDINRTMMSAVSHMTGFFPMGTGPNLPENYPEGKAVPPTRFPLRDYKGKEALPLNFQTVPIHTRQTVEDSFLKSIWYCKSYKEILKKMNETEIYQKIKATFESDFAELFKIMNISVAFESTLESAFDIYDNFQISIYNGRPIPEIPEKLWKNLTFLYNIYFYIVYFNTLEQNQLTATSIMQDFIDYLDDRIANKTSIKWKSWAAHDVNFIQFFSALNLTNWECIYQNFFGTPLGNFHECVVDYPTFATNLIIELYKNNSSPANSTDHGDYFIKFLYDGAYLNLCNSDSKTCTYEALRQIMRNVMIPEEELEKKCELPPPPKKEQALVQISGEEGSEGSWIAVTGAVLILETLCLLILMKKVSKTSSKKKEDLLLYNKVNDIAAV